MHRLTTKRYLQIHQTLQKSWLDLNTYPYSQLTAKERWDLHCFFQPSRVLSKSALLEHRERVTREDGSLPHRVGRAWQRFERAAHERRPATSRMRKRTKRIPSQDREIVITPLVRSEVDLDKFVQALISVAKDSTKQ